MRLVFLGTNGLGPTEDGQTVCFMLPELGIVLDAGSGLFRVGQYLQTDALEIYLTHAHLDHIIGLTYLWSALMHHEIAVTPDEDDFAVLEKRMDAVHTHSTIYSTELILNAIHERFGKWPDIGWRNLSRPQLIPGGGTLTYFPVNHTTECIGFRLDWPGHSLAYVTDTIASPDAAYIQSIRGVDVLLHDSYLPNKWQDLAAKTGHSHTSGAAEVAAKAGVGRLYLIHHNSIGLRVSGKELEAARKIFPATEVGLDKMEVEF